MSTTNVKRVNRKELLQLTFFKLIKQQSEKAALLLSAKMISGDQSGSNYINFGCKEEELEVIRTIDQFLEGGHFSDLCDLTRIGRYMFNLTGKDVTINVAKYERK